MSVSVATVSPASASTANGGTLTITGTFPSAESPFYAFLGAGDMAADLATLWASGNPDLYQLTGAVSGVDEETADAEATIGFVVPAGLLPVGNYLLAVAEAADYAANYATIAFTVTATETFTLSPEELTTDGGTVLVTGIFVVDGVYYGELRGDTTVDLSDGAAVVSSDGTTLTFTVPAGVPAGTYELVVYEVVDEVAADYGSGGALRLAEPAGPPVLEVARDTTALLDGIERWLPAMHCGLRPLLAGLAAAQHEAEVVVDALREQATVELGTERWLTLTAHGQGIQRASAEADADLRLRIRSVDDQVTRPAIEAAVNALLAPDTCEILEWYEHGFLDVELDGEHGLWLDSERLPGRWPSFLVLVPQRGWLSAGAYLDADLWLDTTYIGTAAESAIYLAILNSVERARAAGVAWRLCLAP